MHKIIYFITILALFVGCTNDGTKPEPTIDASNETEQIPTEDLSETLMDYMTGYFTSAKQARADTDYYNIKLKMIPIWQNRTDGDYIYVEQALASNENKPYRQRVYHITQNDKQFISKVYTIPNEENYLYSWKNTRPFINLVPDSLVERAGCEVVLVYENGMFKGSTGATSCKSTLRGASYATSEVEVFVDKIISWDRGFDDKGEHVWGAEKSGYVFDKVASVLRK